jgi:hypothetical protein
MVAVPAECDALDIFDGARFANFPGTLTTLTSVHIDFQKMISECHLAPILLFDSDWFVLFIELRSEPSSMLITNYARTQKPSIRISAV